jgi:hypothetical protein
LGRRRRGLSFCVFADDPRGAGVWKAFDLALVVFMPSGARVRGPVSNQSLLLSRLQIALLTGWSNERIVVAFAVRLQHRLSGLLEHILVVERDLEWCLWRFVTRCFGSKTFCTGVEWLSTRSDRDVANRILLVVCCESGHGYRYIERVVVRSSSSSSMFCTAVLPLVFTLWTVAMRPLWGRRPTPRPTQEGSRLTKASAADRGRSASRLHRGLSKDDSPDNITRRINTFSSRHSPTCTLYTYYHSNSKHTLLL